MLEKRLTIFYRPSHLSNSWTLLIRTVDALNKKIELETIERKKLEKQIKIISNYVGKKQVSWELVITNKAQVLVRLNF
jgi:hypothetical protein